MIPIRPGRCAFACIGGTALRSAVIISAPGAARVNWPSAMSTATATGVGRCRLIRKAPLRDRATRPWAGRLL